MQQGEGQRAPEKPEVRASLERLKVSQLKELLTELGLVKYGRKLELLERIVVYCSEDNAARATRVGQLVKSLLGASAGASAGRISPSRAVPMTGHALQPPSVRHESAAAPPAPAHVVRCVCNNASWLTATNVRCGECGCAQHGACMRIPSHDAAAAAAHVCEVCRLREVDPGTEPLGEPRRLSLAFYHADVPMPTSNRRAQGTVRLTSEEIDLLMCDTRVQLRMYALDLRPPAPFHRWPVALHVTWNGVDVDTRVPAPTWDHMTFRYKVRQVDEVCIISAQHGLRLLPVNQLVCNAVVQSSVLLVVQLVRIRSAAQIATKVLATNSAVDEQVRAFEASRAWFLSRCFPDQHDDDLVQTAVNLTLRCPLALTRLQHPVRSKHCTHTTCFDLNAHLSSQLVSKCARWACPLCGKSARPSELQLDLFVKSILEASSKEGDTEVELHADGSFKPPRQLADETERAKRQRLSGGGAAAKLPADHVVHDLACGDYTTPPLQLLRRQLAEAPCSSCVASSTGTPPDAAAAPACAVGQARADVVQRDMAGVPHDACATAALPESAGTSAEASCALVNIRELFLSLEEDFANANEQARALLGTQPDRQTPAVPAHLRAPPIPGSAAACVSAPVPPPMLAPQPAHMRCLAPGAAVDNPICLD